jgi:hypothetical protein
MSAILFTGDATAVPQGGTRFTPFEDDSDPLRE